MALTGRGTQVDKLPLTASKAIRHVLATEAMVTSNQRPDLKATCHPIMRVAAHTSMAVPLIMAVHMALVAPMLASIIIKQASDIMVTLLLSQQRDLIPTCTRNMRMVFHSVRP